MCPFQTTTSSTDKLVIGTCNQDGTVTMIGDLTSNIGLTFNCELWDTVNIRCGAKVSDTIRDDGVNENTTLITMLEKVIGKESERDINNSIIQYLNNIVGIDGDKESIGGSILTELNHMHTSHWHPKEHDYTELTLFSGGYASGGTGGGGSPFATTLIAEFVGNQYLDGNGKIYGKDFMITDSADKPKMLNSLELGPDWIDPAVSVIWSDILAWSLDRVNINDPLI
jgi:hypothetical protein